MSDEDKKADIEIESLVVFPPFRIQVEVYSQADLSRLRSMLRKEPENLLAQQITIRLHEWMVYQARASAQFREWLRLVDPILYRKIKDTYKIDEVPHVKKES